MMKTILFDITVDYENIPILSLGSRRQLLEYRALVFYFKQTITQ